jgi:hypothetical protein
MDVDG